MNMQVKADVMMLIVTIFWGSSYLFMKMGLHSIPEFNLVALRFGIAFLLSGILFYKRLMTADIKTIKYAFILGLILFLVFVSITFGVKSTSMANAGFLVSFTVIFVPLFSALFLKKIPEKKVLISALLSIIGIGLLTINKELMINTGDCLCMLGAALFAVHIIVTGTLTKNVDSITLGILQLGFAGALGLVFSLSVETTSLPNTFESWLSVLSLSILCSAIGFITQTAAQKHTTPTHTGLIFSLEPVFAMIFAFLFAGETLSLRGYIGAVIILLSVLNAEVDFKKMIFKNISGTPGT